MRTLPGQAAPPPVEDGRMLRLALILAALTAFGPLATDMYLAGFPLLAQSFETELANVQLGLSVFFLGLAGGQVLYGILIDRYGRKRPLMAGIWVFILASLLISAAPNVEIFVALRFLQAIGGAAGMIVSRAIIADLFSQREAARVFSLMMMVQAIGPILAPVLGGYIIASLGWRAVFLVLALFGIGCLVAVHRGLVETLPPEQRGQHRMRDIFGAWGQLLAMRDFILPVLTGSFVLAGLFAFLTGSPFVYMELHGVGERAYGWLFGVNAVGLIAMAQFNRTMLKRFGPAPLVGAGLAVMVSGAVLLVLLSDTASLPLLVGILLICLVNTPLIGANTVALAMAAAGRRRGSGSAIIGLLQFGIGSLASASVGFLHDGTAAPMAWAILGCASLAAIFWLAGSIGRRVE